MKRFRLLTALFAGTLMYVCCSFFFGRDGIWVQKQLLAEKRVLSAHTAEIEKINEDLTLEKTALQKDMDVIASFARKLGYVGQDEKLVKISGLANIETRIFDPGMVLRHKQPDFVPEWVCKVCGIVIFVLVYFLLFLWDLSRGNIVLGNRQKYMQVVSGTPVYDMQKKQS